MKKKSILIAILLQTILLFACGNKNVESTNAIVPIDESALETIRMVEETTIINDVNPLSFEDFIIRGNNSVTRNAPDSNVIHKYPDWESIDWWCQTFVNGDDAQTYRDITLNDKFVDVENKYGKSNKMLYDSDDKMINEFKAGNKDLLILTDGDYYINYDCVISNRKYNIRFYFDGNDTLKLILYYYYYNE